MLPKMLQNRRKNRQICSLNGPRGAPGERSWNLPRGTGEKTSILTGFGSPFGSPGASLGDPGGTHFRPWALPGRLQGAEGANFKPSWACPIFDIDSGLPKMTKKVQFRRCPNLENCTGASTGVQFPLFHNIHARPRKSPILGAFLEAF